MMSDFKKSFASDIIQTSFNLLASQGIYLQSGLLVFGTEPNEKSRLDVYYGAENE